MGEVYRGRDTRLERTVAIKVSRANVFSDSNLRARLEREAKAVSKLSHPPSAPALAGVDMPGGPPPRISNHEGTVLSVTLSFGARQSLTRG